MTFTESGRKGTVRLSEDPPRLQKQLRLPHAFFPPFSPSLHGLSVDPLSTATQMGITKSWEPQSQELTRFDHQFCSAMENYILRDGIEKM